MPFKVTNINVDLMSSFANLVAMDQPPQGGQAKMVQVSFPFDPPAKEGKEKDLALAAAKALLQQALTEL
jgi:hypothetical protein